MTVQRGGTMVTISPDAQAVANEETIKVSGFTFDGANSASVIIQVNGAGASASKPFKNLVLINNRFKDPSQTSSSVIYQTGQVRGVVGNNLFDRPMIVTRCFGNDSKTEFTNAAFFPPAFGSADNLYYEDNIFQWPTAGGTSGYRGWIECGHGGRIVMRYNTWAMANASGQDENWDVHGFQNWSGGSGGQTGTMTVEYYGNTITSKLGYRVLFHRGGQGLYFNNSISGTGNSYQVSNQDGGCHNDIQAGWPPPFVQTNNTYFFNNTHNGAASALSRYPTADNYNLDCPPVENTDFWNFNANCTASACAAGIGRGATPPTGTCSTGTGYWVAGAATPTTNPSLVQAGRLYKCTSPNVWMQYYAPYAYPHPLRGGVAVADSAPAPPKNLRIP